MMSFLEECDHFDRLETVKLFRNDLPFHLRRGLLKRVEFQLAVCKNCKAINLIN